jgi:hypothetical protein
MMEPRRAYRVLGLLESAGPDDVKVAWRDLAQVWHPDRFPADSRLRAKAENNLKRINEAYEALKDRAPAAAAPGVVARMRASVVIGLGDLRDSVFTQAPPIGLRRSLRVVGLGPQRSGEFRAHRPFSPTRLWVSVTVLLALGAVALFFALRR